jgi:hypothetical protein
LCMKTGIGRLISSQSVVLVRIVEGVAVTSMQGETVGILCQQCIVIAMSFPLTELLWYSFFIFPSEWYDRGRWFASRARLAPGIDWRREQLPVSLLKI